MDEPDPTEQSSRRVLLRGPGCLTVARGDQVGLVYRVGDERVTIGRGDDADVVVVSEGVSRRHAELIRNATGSIKIVDLDSRNGTFVNRVRVSTAVLEDGDRIRIGESAFDFHYERADDRTTVDLAASTPAARSGDKVAERFLSTMSNLECPRSTGSRASSRTTTRTT
ncbi:MAG: FHA domain-containing protein, partial [Myxococcota bacterium]